MSVVLFIAQRASAVVLAVAVLVHLATILYAVRSGLTAGAILGRTQGNIGFLVLYLTFVVAIAVHAPIGLRNVLREWTGWRGRSLDIVMTGLALVLLMLGLRATLAVFMP